MLHMLSLLPTVVVTLVQRRPRLSLRCVCLARPSSQTSSNFSPSGARSSNECRATLLSRKSNSSNSNTTLHKRRHLSRSPTRNTLPLLPLNNTFLFLPPVLLPLCLTVSHLTTIPQVPAVGERLPTPLEAALWADFCPPTEEEEEHLDWG